MLRRAQTLDPFELLAAHLLCLVQTYTGEFDKAGAMAARLDAIWPGQLAPYWDRFWLLAASRRFAEAGAWLGDRARRPHSESEEYAVLGQTVAALQTAAASPRRAAGAALLALAREGVGYAGNSMLMLTALGLLDEALELARALYLQKGPIQINRAIEFRDNSRFPMHGETDPVSLFHPFMAPLRRSGRLTEIFDGIGLSDFWRAAGPADA
jgi:hypothetical protein